VTDNDPKLRRFAEISLRQRERGAALLGISVFEFPDSGSGDPEIHAENSNAGADRWPRDSRIVELFCGRGGGLRSLDRLGFTQVEGVDLSMTLLAEYTGPAQVLACDCQDLLFENESKDIVIIHDGLHHLPGFPGGLKETLHEILRVLKPGGRIVIFEPWLTPFLRILHAVSKSCLIRKIFSSIDAFAVMVDHERPVYYRWLGHPALIIELFGKYFLPEQCIVRRGQLSFVGSKPADG